MRLLPSGAFVYRLGHGPLKAERRVRFPYALPFAFDRMKKTNRLNCAGKALPTSRGELGGSFRLPR